MDEFDPSYGFGEEPVSTGFGMDDAFGVQPEASPVAEPASTGDAWGLDGVDDDTTGSAEPEQSSPTNEDVFGLGETAAEHMSAFIAQPIEEETDAYTKWESNHKKALQARGDQQRSEKKQLIADAKKELDGFYAKRDEALKKTKAVNRSEQTQWTSELAKTNASGTEWEKVAKYCDLKPRAESKVGQTKNERMRKLLVSLKTDGFVATK